MSLSRLIWSRTHPPKPSTASFAGQTILITAATGGLGLEAAKKLAAQGTSTLIITARDEKKGAAARSAIETHLKSLDPNPNSSVTIIPLVLEMSDPDSIRSFIASLKTHTSHLDHAILNAGLVQTTHTLAPTNYELTYQVNTISTVLLSLLLLPFLLASPLTSQPSVSQRPHLSYVSSGTAWVTSLESLQPYSSNTPISELSKPESFPPGRFGAGGQYGRSKLLLEYCSRPISRLPSLLTDPNDLNSMPKVLVTSTCPGMCRSDLGRGYTENSWILNAISQVILFIIARTAEVGANSYITSLGVGEDGRGEMWKDDRAWVPESQKNIRSEEAKVFGGKVWMEMRKIVEGMDGTGVVREMLGEHEK